MDFEACRNASVDLRHLTAPSLKALMNCLNGDGQLQSYKVFLDSVSNEELESLIKVFDRHITTAGNRLDLILDLASRARTKGILKQLYSGLENVTATESLQELANLLAKVYGRFQKHPDYKTNAALLRRLSRDLIEQRVTDQGIQGLGRGLNGGKGQSLAFFLSRTSSRFPLVSDQIVDELAKVGKSLMDDRSLRTLQILAADPAIHQSFSTYTPTELVEIEKLFLQVSKGASRGELKTLQGLKKLTVKSDREMLCFDDGKTARSFQNLFDIAADEQGRRRKDFDRINRFWLVEMPVLISASLSKCDLDSSIVDDLDVTSDLAKRGLATGLAMGLLGFYDKNRGTYVKNLLKSTHSVEAGSLIENLATRQGTTYAIEMITKGFRSADFLTISRAMTASMVRNFSDTELDTWLAGRFNGSVLAQLRAAVAELPAGQRNILNLLSKLEAKGPSEETLRMRLSLSDDPVVSPNEKATYDFMNQLLSDEARPLLKKAALALVQSWDHSGGGWGNLAEFVAQTITLADERPIQDFMLSLLANEADYETVTDFLIRYSGDPKFREVLKFTGQIAGDGNLDRLVSFLLDFFKATGAPGLNPAPNTPGYSPSGDKFDLAEVQNRKLPEPSPAAGDYSSCNKIRGNLFESSGETFYNAMKCFDFNKGGAGFGKLADLLKSGGLLKNVTALVSSRFFDPKYVNALLDDMRGMYDSGHFRKFMTILQLGVEDPYYLNQLADPALSGMLASSRSDFALLGLGQLMNSPAYPTGASTAIGTLGSDLKTPIFKSTNQWPIPLKNEAELRAQAFSKVPNLTEAAWQRAKTEYQMHSNDYFYRQGIYKQFSDQQLRDDIIEWFRKLVVENPETGYGDAEALIDAVNDLAVMEAQGKVKMAEFFRWGSSKQKAIPYYVDENDEPELRIVSPFDQLDILVANSNMSVKFLGQGADHLGVYFQIEIAKSTNFAETLKSLKGEMEKGITICNLKIFFPKLTCNRLKNNLANFEVLVDMANQGHMLIQQRLYQAFRASTPAKYYDKQDPINNHIAMTHKHVDWGMFSRMVTPLAYVDSQGVLDAFGEAMAKAGPLFNRQDVPKLRMAFKKLLAPRQNRTNDLGYFIDSIMNLIDTKPQGFITFKEMMFHYILNWPKMTDRTTGVVEILDLLAGDERIVRDSIDWIFEDVLKNPADGALYKTMINLNYIEPGPMAAIRQLGGLMLRPNSPTNESYALGFADMFLSLYRRDEVTFDQLFDRMTAFSKDPRVKQLAPAALLQEMIPKYGGVRKILAETLLDTADRRTVETLLKDMSREKVASSLIKTMVELHQSGDLENLIYFLNKHAVKVTAP